MFVQCFILKFMILYMYNYKCAKLKCFVCDWLKILSFKTVVKSLKAKLVFSPPNS